MAILGNILSGLLNTNDTGASAKPCRNCPSDCALCPNACEVCKPFKEKLIDQLYDVEHSEEFYARYEVTGTAAEDAGTVVCEACGGSNPGSAFVCEYCGTQLRESSGKIQVESAKDIPDPFQLAQDTIFARQEAVSAYAESGGGLLEGLADLLGGGSSAFGDRMSDDEIKQTAQAYGVSVSDYLQGLDNGKYKTASAKQAQEARSAALGAGAGVGVLGGTLGGAAVGLGRQQHGSRSDARPPMQGHGVPSSHTAGQHPQSHGIQTGHGMGSSAQRGGMGAGHMSGGHGGTGHGSGGHGGMGHGGGPRR